MALPRYVSAREFVAESHAPEAFSDLRGVRIRGEGIYLEVTEVAIGADTHSHEPYARAVFAAYREGEETPLIRETTLFYHPKESSREGQLAGILTRAERRARMPVDTITPLSITLEQHASS